MHEPARVLWLIKGLARGGAEALVCGLAKHLDRDRFQPEVAFLLPEYDALVPTLERLDVPVHCLGARSDLDLRWVRRLRHLVTQRKFDLVHTHSPAPAAAARVALPRSVPMVHSEYQVWSGLRASTRLANAITLRRNAAVVALSEAVAASIHPPRSLGGATPPVEVLRHGIDHASIAHGAAARVEARRRLGLTLEMPVIGVVANFFAKKEHNTLLDAYARLRATHPDLHLVLVGFGPLEQALRARVAEAGWSESVHFTGARDDVAQILAGFDVFVLTSRYEGLGLVLLEAMAAGLPCVASNIGGVREVVEEGRTGFLVPPGNPAATAAAVDQLLRDPGLRQLLGDNGRLHAQRFDLPATTRRIEQLYEGILERLGAIQSL